MNTNAELGMRSAELISEDLAASHNDRGVHRERSAPPEGYHPILTGRSDDRARAAVRRALPSFNAEAQRRRVQKQEIGIVEAARKVIIKDILDILGDDLPSRRGHKRYLEGRSLDALDARRRQLRAEQLPMQRQFLTEDNKDNKGNKAASLTSFPSVPTEISR